MFGGNDGTTAVDDDYAARGLSNIGAWILGRVGGGVATIQQYLRAGLVDEAHLAISPVLLGSGESMFSGLDMVSLGYRCTEHVSTPNATHIVLTRPR
jgi:riboflavin biosynthesis pyrimidine reductase